MMLSEVLAWGLRPIYVTGDSWYSSKENLKFLKKQEEEAKWIYSHKFLYKSLNI